MRFDVRACGIKGCSLCVVCPLGGFGIRARPPKGHTPQAVAFYRAELTVHMSAAVGSCRDQCREYRSSNSQHSLHALNDALRLRDTEVSECVALDVGYLKRILAVRVCNEAQPLMRHVSQITQVLACGCAAPTCFLRNAKLHLNFHPQ